MFGVLRCKRSTSSLVVHHSSSESIPTPGRPEEVPLGISADPLGLPAGTIPNTPTPLHMVLEHDNFQACTRLDSSPAQPRRLDVDQMLAAMPGTNLGSDNDEVVCVASSAKGVGAGLSGLPTEPSSYFNIPVSNTSPRSSLRGADYASDSPISVQPQGAYFIDAIIRGSPSPVDIYSMTARSHQHDALTGRCDSMLSRCNHHDKKAPHEGTARTRQTNCDTSDLPTDQPSAYETYLSRQAEAQLALQNQAHPPVAATLEPFPVLDTDPKPAQNTWGTRGSIYDGTGYGDTPSPSSARPSTSSTALETHAEAPEETGFTSASLALESVAMARDHETLQEVIRLHAALEEEGSSMIIEDVMGDVVADAELANKMAGHSLGA
jgi:hypothetical protein